MKTARAFRFAFKTKGAGSKLLRGGFYLSLFFTVFFPFSVMGYLMRLLCDLLEGRSAEMPRWQNRVELFNDGLQPVLIALAYFGPAVALAGVELIVPSLFLFALQGVLVLAASAFFPLAVIHAVTRGTINGAFHFRVLGAYVRQNFKKLLRAWLILTGLNLIPVIVAALVALLLAVPIALVSDIGIGATIGVVFGVVTFCLILFPVAVVSVHLWAQVYRASAPFADDTEGASRAAVVMPPSLHPGGK